MRRRVGGVPPAVAAAEAVLLDARGGEHHKQGVAVVRQGSRRLEDTNHWEGGDRWSRGAERG